jgi:hypothetical protein
VGAGGGGFNASGTWARAAPADKARTAAIPAPENRRRVEGFRLIVGQVLPDSVNNKLSPAPDLALIWRFV